MIDYKLEIEEILQKALLIWKQDYPKFDRDDVDSNEDKMVEYFGRLEKARIEAINTLTQLIEAEKVKAVLEELDNIDDELYDITSVDWGQPTEGSKKEWGENYAYLYVPTRDMHKVLKDRIKELEKKGEA